MQIQMSYCKNIHSGETCSSKGLEMLNISSIFGSISIVLLLVSFGEKENMKYLNIYFLAGKLPIGLKIAFKINKAVKFWDFRSGIWNVMFQSLDTYVISWFPGNWVPRSHWISQKFNTISSTISWTCIMERKRTKATSESKTSDQFNTYSQPSIYNKCLPKIMNSESLFYQKTTSTLWKPMSLLKA